MAAAAGYSKKEKILLTAGELFQRHGIRRITVEEICRTAGVSKMTFYRNFANKADLAGRLWDLWAGRLFDKLDELKELNLPFPEKLEMLFRWKWSIASEMNPEFLEDFIDVRGEVEKIALRFKNFVIDAQQKGQIRPEVNPDFILAAMEKLSELSRVETVRGLYPSPEAFGRELKDFLWYGLLPR